MNNFFAVPTDAWGDDAVTLTAVGICMVTALIVILIGIALFAYRREAGSGAKITTKQLVFSAMALALAMVTSMIKLVDMPLGGSITLLSMLFIALIGYWYGPVAGIATGMAYGLLQFILEPIFYTIPQMLNDYPLAFGALGLSGFFQKRKFGLQIGYAVGVLGRFVFSFLSGVLFFASYAPEGMHPALYSLLYNGSYLLGEAVLTLVVISIPPVYKALKHVRGLAGSD
ncbi:MAG: energy-coupled thiamine transporter ThiT [Clostridium sp.]|nr:energy-coupled thiamine transporter ThiT [Acetatifactor muris]MCM1528348.1 energy-coupled thiamine transporter ThiT [Bacteroides sp.]MCM1563939.1 energy-coupled thiamine transporter ThiT [Clostridium sp.]